MSVSALTRAERRVAYAMAGIFGTRMLGLFLIVPVFVEYSRNLHGYTPALAGLAIGIYGLAQALLQVPLGRLSDRVGRKPVIVGGLLVFAAGSVVAALSDSMTGVIVGRTLQGAGAIASAVLALTADLTREEHRVKIMAFIGMSIGLSFALAMVFGPLLHHFIGLSGLFWAIAGLALVGIGIVTLVVPTPVQIRFHRDTEVETGWIGRALRDTQLLRVDFGIFVLHAALMATFVVVPGLLVQAGLGVERHWLVYLPVMAVGMGLIVPFIILAEKKRRLKGVLIGAVALLVLTELGMAVFADRLGDTLAGLVIMLLLFFAAFNLLEAMLPSLVAKLAPAAHKGTAMGVYSTTQFLGVFAGGSAGGWLLQHHGTEGVFLATAGLAGVWLLLAVTMRRPSHLQTRLLNVGSLDTSAARVLAERLSRVHGVVEATVIPEDGVAYLKVDGRELDEAALAAVPQIRDAA